MTVRFAVVAVYLYGILIGRTGQRKRIFETLHRRTVRFREMILMASAQLNRRDLTVAAK